MLYIYILYIYIYGTVCLFLRYIILKYDQLNKAQIDPWINPLHTKMIRNDSQCTYQMKAYTWCFLVHVSKGLGVSGWSLHCECSAQ